MKERPILFNGPMVRAILCGRKTQTRRVCKSPIWTDVAVVQKCPYGQPGDRLWVREKHAPMLGGGWVYAADYSAERLKQKDGRGFWKPSIFMKREASRITLEIVSVRLERLRDISGIDAWREGCMYHPKAYPTIDDVIAWYRELWESINGAGSWDANPWVWVVEFNKL